MKLPFRQLPELPEGHGLLVGAPVASGRTFFLTSLADLALKAGIDTAYFNVDWGLNYFIIKLCRAGHEKLTYVDLSDAVFNADTAMAALDAGLHAKLLIIDDWDSFSFRATRPRHILNELGIDEREAPTPIGFMAKTLMETLRQVQKRKSYFVFGVNNRRDQLPPQKPAECDPLVWEARLKCYPIPFTPPRNIVGLPTLPDNLMVVNLLREGL